ncbi:MAG TPA: lipopolysaccharide kinase InaA family protein [Candidatus Binataceae bacterium]|nr:lipopolysaccharide kinase InaA family protein [Candidatus Binataceae bacterium]
MRPAGQMQWRSDPNFPKLTIGGREIVLHRTIVGLAAPILEQLGRLKDGAGQGNRGSAFRLNVAGAPEMFARRSSRGGLMRFIASDLHVGIYPRQFEELSVAVECMRRGAPVAEPMGAIVEWIAPVLYRGFFLTRAIPGRTLWEFLQADDDPSVRSHVLAQAHAAIDAIHSRGLEHGDLNLHNLLVTQSGENFTVIVLDLDKARLHGGPVPAAAGRANFTRLVRSTHKLDPAGRILDAAALKLLAG